MAQLAVAAAGAAISTALGAGPGLGWAIGSVIGAVAFAPKQDVPGVSDLKAPQVQYGSQLPRLYGSNRTAGTLAWYSAKRVVAGDSGGKGDPASPTADTAEIDVLYILGYDSPVIAITRVWKNGELVWTGHVGSDTASFEASAVTDAWGELRFLDGNPSQLPDPTIEASEGVGNAPAYRYRQGALIESLQLGQSGQMPLIEFECITAGSSALVGDGFLCHFDELTGPKVLSALGPDLTLSGGTSLDNTQVMFGSDNAGLGNYPTGSSFSGTGITGDLTGKSWRFEGFVNPASLHGTLFSISGGPAVGTVPSFTVGIEADAYNAYPFSITSDVESGGGILGSAAQALPLGVYSHFAVQFDVSVGRLVFLVNGGSDNGGHTAQIFTGAPNGYAGRSYTTVSVGITLDGYIDECRLIIDPPDIYGDAYTVPTAPFTGQKRTVWTETAADLADIVTAEWERVADASLIDVSELVGIPVRGFQTSGSVRAAFEALAPVFHFGAVCSDKLYFRLMGSSSAATIAFDELAAAENHAADEPFAPERANDDELPERVAITYPNHSDDYNAGTETGARGVSGSTIVQTVQSNVVMSPAEAKAVAETLAAQIAVAATTGEISLTDYYAELESTDCILVPDEDATIYRMRITRETYGGGVRQFELVRDDVTTLIAPGITNEDYSQSLIVASPEDTEILLLDIPILRDVDDDPGFYGVAKGSTHGSILYSSLDDVTYTEEVKIPNQSVFGGCLSTLPDWTGQHVFDEVSSLTVNVGSGALSSSTRNAMLADQSINACAIGVDGRWELCQFRDASLVSTGVYTLTGWLRGARGTEWAMLDHVADETFVMLTAAGVRRVAMQQSEIGVAEYWKGVTAGRLLSTATGELFTDNGIGEKPFSPVDLRKGGDESAVVVTWKRRTRMAPRFCGTGGINVPLGETSESYDVDLYDSGDALVSSVTVTEPEWTAPSAETTGNLSTPVSEIASIGVELVGIRADNTSYGSETYRFTRQTTAGALVAESANLGNIVYQWTNDGDNLYACTADLYIPPGTYANTKIKRYARTSLGSLAASYTSPTAGDLHGVACDGSHIWATEFYGGNLRKLDKSTLASVATYALDIGLGRLKHYSGSLWITSDYTDEVIEWDIGTTAELQRFSVVDYPNDLLLVGSLLFVRGGSQIGVYTAATGALVAAIEAASSGLGSGLFEFDSYVAAAAGSEIVLIDSATGLESRRIDAQVTYLGQAYVYLRDVAGADGDALYATLGAPGVSNQTVAFELAAPALAGYSLVVYQNAAVLGRGYPATLEL